MLFSFTRLFSAVGGRLALSPVDEALFQAAKRVQVIHWSPAGPRFLSVTTAGGVPFLLAQRHFVDITGGFPAVVPPEAGGAWWKWAPPPAPQGEPDPAAWLRPGPPGTLSGVDGAVVLRFEVSEDDARRLLPIVRMVPAACEP